MLASVVYCKIFMIELLPGLFLPWRHQFMMAG
jgi:hypothetical protein